VADRLKPGRFFIGAKGDGLYRSDDSGVTWKEVFGHGISNVATDVVVAGRVAAGTADGVVLSIDGGNSWKALDKALPYRVDNVPAFAGERLLVGTGGSGVFWMPLSSTGETTMTAKPLVVAQVPVTSTTMPVLTNLDFEEEGTPVPGWKVTTTAGSATVVRSGKAGRGTPHGLLITAQPRTVGSVSQEFTPTSSLLQFAGSIWPKGDWQKVRVEIESFDRAGKLLGISASNPLSGNKTWWESVTQGSGIPQGTVRCRLSVTFEGEGTIALDGFRFLKPESPLFLDARSSHP
jgi:hypothetical protein